MSSLSHVSAFLCRGLGSDLRTLSISHAGVKLPVPAVPSTQSRTSASPPSNLPTNFCSKKSRPFFFSFFLSPFLFKNSPATALLTLLSNSRFCGRQFLGILRIFLIAWNCRLCFPVRGFGSGEPSNHLGCISAVNGFKAGQAALGGKELSEYFLDFLSVLKAEFWALFYFGVIYA